VGMEGAIPEPPGPFVCGPDRIDDDLPECFYPPGSCF